MSPQVTDTDIELLSQYLDGELPAADSRALEARLHTDSELQTTMLRMQELNQQLRDSFAEHASVPTAVSQLLEDEAQESGATVLRFPSRKAETSEPNRRWPYAIAASFAAVMAISMMGDYGPSVASLPGNDALVSAALDTQQSGAEWATLRDGRELQTVLTFPHEDGRWCREYLLKSESDWRAVACREDGEWVTQAAGLESFLESADAYRPAGANDSAPVAVFISQHAADIALGWEAEEALISKGWD